MMKKQNLIKKTLLLILSLGLLAGLAACGDKSTSQASGGTAVPSGGSEAVASQPVGGNTGAPVQGEEGWFRYVDIEGGVEITGYLGEEGNIIIPDTLGGKSVVSIGEKAFHNNKILISVTIPDSVVIIKQEAFQLCDNLEYLNMGNSVKEVEEKSFFMCGKLTEVVFSNLLEKTGLLSFGSCSSLESVDIPTSLYAPGESMLAGSGIVEINIPGSMKNISERFLNDCPNLKKITIEDGVESIGYEAFFECFSLKEIYVSSSVIDFGKALFSANVDFTIITPSGSAAETYAIERNISYRNE